MQTLMNAKSMVEIHVIMEHAIIPMDLTSVFVHLAISWIQVAIVVLVSSTFTINNIEPNSY